MKGDSVIYNGRQVPIAGFRVFVYDKDGNQKLVGSWPAFQVAIASGLWFSTLEESQAIKEEATKEMKYRPKPKG